MVLAAADSFERRALHHRCPARYRVLIPVAHVCLCLCSPLALPAPAVTPPTLTAPSLCAHAHSRAGEHRGKARGKTCRGGDPRRRRVPARSVHSLALPRCPTDHGGNREGNRVSSRSSPRSLVLDMAVWHAHTGWLCWGVQCRSCITLIMVWDLVAWSRGAMHSLTSGAMHSLTSGHFWSFGPGGCNVRLITRRISQATSSRA